MLEAMNKKGSVLSLLICNEASIVPAQDIEVAIWKKKDIKRSPVFKATLGTLFRIENRLLIFFVSHHSTARRKYRPNGFFNPHKRNHKPAQTKLTCRPLQATQRRPA
jgi:hypothetical protein